MWIKLKCNLCGKVQCITHDYMTELISTHGSIGCGPAICGGTMHPFGQAIKNAKTKMKYADRDYLDRRDALARGTKRKRPDYDDGPDDPTDVRHAKRNKAEDDDDEYVLPADFNPSMRLTSKRMETFPLPATLGMTPKDSGINDVTNAIAGERQKSTNNAMNGWAAWDYARTNGAPNADKYRVGGQSHYEWCHLHADSLGGKCEGANLVAGHYALNTYMMTIEEVLNAKSQFRIAVTAYCDTPHIARLVEYKIYAKSSGNLLTTIQIDGAITQFSRIDYDTVKTNLKRTLGLT